MTTREFAEAAGLSPTTVRHLLECGLLLTSNGRVIGDGQVERARLIQLLLRKGMTLAQLSAANLAFDAGQK